MSIYSIAVSALNAAQTGLSTTSHNIANANTPGYSRQEIVQSGMTPQNTGAGYLGQGVNVSNVVRHYDQFLGAQVLEAQTSATNLNTQLGLAQQVSNMLGDSSSGLTPAMQSFFTAVNAVANAPQSMPARQTMISSAQALTGSVQMLDQNLNQLRDSLNGQVSNSVSQINNLSTQIAKLNDQIVQLEANTPGQQPNDLLDQRDQLVTQLSQEIRVSTVTQFDGSMNVFIGNGQSLVLGNKTTRLQVTTSATDPTALDVAYSNNGVLSGIQQSSLQGGNLGAFINARQTIIDPAINALGRIAMGVADAFNQQQQQGLDLKGGLGVSMFTTAVPSVAASANNKGTGVLTATINSVSGLTATDFSVQFDGTNYKIYDTSNSTLLQSITPAQMAAGQTVTGTGITLQLTSGAVSTSDNFLVRPTVNGAKDFALSITDPARIAAAAPIRSNAPLSNLGSASISAATVSGGLPLNPNLQDNVTVSFIDSTHYTVTDTTLGTTLAPSTLYNPAAGATLTFNGWTTQISGSPAAGDTFTVSANTNATTDGSNSLLMAALQTANTLANGTTSFQGAYGQLIGQVGTQTNQLSVISKAQTGLLTSVTAAQQAVSGVNLDEEAANLLRYQQAYQAAGKAMQIANTMFETILNLK